MGLEEAGFKVLWQCENNLELVSRVLQPQFGVKVYWDVRDLVRQKPAQVTMLVGGDPCQENSNANRTGSYSQRSLGADYISVVDSLRPRLVLRENPSRTRADAPWSAEKFADALRRLGYQVLPIRIRGCCVGAKHRRERMFLLAERTGADAMPERLQRDVEQILEAPTCNGGGEAICYPARLSGWDSRPSLRDVAPRVSCPVDDQWQHRALGNAVIPQVAYVLGSVIGQNWRYLCGV